MATPTSKDKVLESKLRQMLAHLDAADKIMDGIKRQDIQGTSYERCDWHGAEGDIADAYGAISLILKKM